MNFYKIKITSKNFNLRSEAALLADDEDQAKKMAGDEFHRVVQSFLTASVMRGNQTGKPETVIDKEKLLSGARYEISCVSIPVIINSGWDRIK